MNEKHFLYVRTLSEERSFSRAAEVLNISQPSLSQSIRKIEQNAGTELFDRSGADVRLTDAGRLYLESAQQILDIERRMKSAFADFADGTAGTIVIGTTPYRSSGMLPSIVSEFMKIRPGYRLVTDERNSSALADGVARGDWDLCLMPLPSDLNGLEYEPVMEEEYLLAVPYGYPEPAAEPVPCRRYPAVPFSAINGMQMVVVPERLSMGRAMREFCSLYGVTVREAAVVDSLESSIAMVRRGVAPAFVLSGIERFCGEGEVRFYSFREELPRRKIAAVWKKGSRLSSAEKELLAVIRSIPW